MSRLLRGLPAQIFLVTLLPLIVIVIAVSFGSIAMHQANMRELVSERDMRTAMATASMLQNLLKQSPDGKLPLTPQQFAMLINPMPDQPHVTAFVADLRGQVLYHTEAEWVGTDMHQHGGVAEALRAEHGVLYRVDHMGGDEHMIAYAPIVSGTQRLSLIIEEPWQTVVDPTMQYSMIGPLIMLPVLLVCAAALILVVTRIVRPLQQLRGQAQRASLGELAALAQPVHGVEEIEHLHATLTSMAGQIEQDEARLRNYAQSITLAQEQERQRLARELHDDTIQNLIVLSQRIQLAKLGSSHDSTTKARLDDMRVHVLQMIEDVRRFSRALHPIYLEATGLVSAIERLVSESDKIAQQQVPACQVTFAVVGQIPRLSPDEELTCFRIAQEGINNAVKHARATAISVQLCQTDAHHLVLSIQDNGSGFAQDDHPPNGWGLTGMRERAASIGAHVDIKSAIGRGTHVSVMIRCVEPSSPSKQ